MDSLNINIPVGIEEGTALRVSGRGLPSPRLNEPPGDLFVVINSQTDPRFERQGADLWRTDTIELVDAVLGKNLTLPPLEGNLEVSVPAGTQSDSELRLRDKGLPVFAAAHRGDLNVRFIVHIPERLSTKERKLYEQLRDMLSAEYWR